MHGPSDETLSWAESALGQRVIGSRGLREGGAPWLLTFAGGVRVVLRSGGAFDTEVAALRLAAEREIPAPRLLAVGDGVMLISVVLGSSRIPVLPTAARLTSLGAIAATVHAVKLTPTKELPLRHRPIELVDFQRLRDRADVSALLREAGDAVARLPEPACAPVFVHGDFWQGNTMWRDGQLSAVVDWDCAGAGHPGVDLGSLRCDAAVMFGGDAAELVLAGWQRYAGRAAEDLAYWDVVAALSTPPNFAEWESNIQDQGRKDLGATILTARRDGFLRAALHRLASTAR